MTRYLTLLRGINVGGRNRVLVVALRELLESDGHTKVSQRLSAQRTKSRLGKIVGTSVDKSMTICS